ncbi:hypothetical protein ACQKGC_05845 [Allorhizobium pseudoryzae]|uniref:hypothetical protein n=1 Tax=Allorhizobium pseudoryzae TaxID=379684 RepID=UPI003CFCA713
MSQRKKSAASTDVSKVAEGTSSNVVETLLGSSVLPSLIDIGLDAPVQLGEVVMAAHAESGLSIEAWNSLADAEREKLLTEALENMKAAVAAGAVNENTEGGSADASGAPSDSVPSGPVEPAAPEPAAAPSPSQVAVAETVTGYLSSPVRFGGKKHMPGRPVRMPASVFAELRAKGLVALAEDDD